MCRHNIDCDDGNPCTIDTCKHRKCSYKPVLGCTFCNVNSDCPPGPVCTDAICSAQICTYPVNSSCFSLVSIAVQPVNQVINSVSVEQFHAIGTFSDGSTADITNIVHWTSSNVGAATISNAAGSHGLATAIAPGATIITASLDVMASTNLTVVSPSPPLFAYTTQQDSTVIKCAMNADGSFGACDTLSDPTFVTTFGIAFNRDHSIAYIVNRDGNSVSQCSVSVADGSFVSCALVGSLFSSPTGIALIERGP